MTPLESKIHQQAIASGIQLFLKKGARQAHKKCPRRCNYLRFDPDGSVWDGASS